MRERRESEWERGGASVWERGGGVSGDERRGERRGVRGGE